MSSSDFAMPGAALKLSTVLSLTALTVSLLQGVIGLESSRPARLSERKTNFILLLQVSLLPIIIAVETVVFIEARSGLSRALRYLWWAPGTLALLGFLALVQDTLYTLYSVCSSRIYWIPLCQTRRRQDRWIEAVPVLIAGALVTVLVCWRQKWIFSEKIVPSGSPVPMHSLSHSLLIGVVVIAVLGAAAATALALGMLRANATINPVHDLRHLRNPSSYRREAQNFDRAGARDRDNHRHIDEERTKRQFTLLAHLQRGGDVASRELKNIDVRAALDFMPLHMRNLIVGEDQFLTLPCKVPFRQLQRDGGWDVFEVLACVQMISIYPLLIVVVVAVFKLHSHFSEELFLAFKELVDAVLVYTALNVSFGLKRLLWSVSGCYENEMNRGLEMDMNMRYTFSSLQDCLPMSERTESTAPWENI